MKFSPVSDPLPAGNTFGKAIAGILAHSKGRSIGIYEDKEKDEEGEKEKAAEEEKSGVRKVDVFNMKVRLAFVCSATVQHLPSSVHCDGFQEGALSSLRQPVFICADAQHYYPSQLTGSYACEM